MRANLVFMAVLIMLTAACRMAQMQTIEFVKGGVPQNLEIRDMWTEDGGYLQADEVFFLKAEKAVYGDEIAIQMRLSVDDSEGHIVITVGDNTLGLSSEVAKNLRIDSDDKIIYLTGPSIGKAVILGAMSDFIIPSTPFNLSITYEHENIIYTIDGKEIYTGETDIPPAGLIRMEEYGGNFRVYDLVCEGRFKPVDTFYTKEFLLDRAHTSVARAAERVKDDPNRPAYHFQPPANWNNDPNGMLFYEGYYHMFYQHNPYGDRWDWMHWGHARSRDLVHWEHLPIALWPSVQKGENHCFSGSGYIKDDGKPILFYTSIGHEDPEHWAALPLDKDLKDWEKHPANPIIVMEDHDSQYIEDWRDPFLFREGNDTYMVIGGHPEDESGSIMMYKALNSELTEWDFLGTPFTGEEGNWECPNFFKVGDKYVLIYSPHGRVEYYTGIMDFDRLKFTPEYHGSIDNGAEWNYYAPNTLQKEDDRRILFGWIPGFKENQGWQGAISLPRDLSIDTEGRLIQKPVPELTAIRGELVSETDVALRNSSKEVEVHYPQFELMVNLAGGGTNHIGFRFNDEDGIPYEIALEPETIRFDDETIAIDPPLEDQIQMVHLFFDRTIIEIFVNDGLLCATKVIYPDRDNLNFEVFSQDGEIVLESIDTWEIISIW